MRPDQARLSIEGQDHTDLVLDIEDPREYAELGQAGQNLQQ